MRLVLTTAFLLVLLALAIGGIGKLFAQHQPGECGYYTNSNGNQVSRPCGNWRTDTGPPPTASTALCRDGTYSFSQHPHASGTCSHHWGVSSYR